MKQARHCFLSESGEILARWQEAFPKAVGMRFTEAAQSRPAPTLLWVRLPQDRAVAPLLAEIRRRLGSLPCVVLSDLPDDTQALESFSAAAKGYCNTHAAAAFLRQVAEVVGQGGLWIGESLMTRLVEATARIESPPPMESSDSWAAHLTPREQEVARAIAEGASNKEIARGLGITERTVKLHVGAVLEKLGVRDRLQIALIVSGIRQSQSA